MNIFFTIALILLIIAIMITLGILITKVEKLNKEKSIQTLQDVLDEKAFYPSEILFVNKHLSIALNKMQTKIAIVKNFNPNNPNYFEYSELSLSFIEKIEKGILIKVHYLKKGEIKILNIYPTNPEIKEFFHKIFKLSLIKRIETRYSQHRFTNFATSDWECSYIWAYSKFDCTFAYLKIGAKEQGNKINLKKEHFTIDTKYGYFEAPIFGIAQQLFTYEKEFLYEVKNEISNIITQKCATITPNSIYYDHHSNIIYLTNGETSLQSIIINKIEEVFYRDNRISFSLIEEDRTINYITNQQQISDFEDFVINYNLKKIAQNFDHKTDKLINTTPNTKFIIDFTRNRVVYCANLNKFVSFSYLFIAFDNILNIYTEKSGAKNFIRIHTKDTETIDVTCDKKEVAQYIEAQMVKLI